MDARSLVGAKWGAIGARHQATWSLLERSIHEIYQVSRHNQTLRPTLGISFASRGSGVQIPSAPPSSCRSGGLFGFLALGWGAKLT